MFCGRGGVASFGPPRAENFWENTGFFAQPAAGQKMFFFLGEGSPNGAIYTHFFTQPEGENNFVFWGQNGAIYIPVHLLHTCCRRKNSGIFWVKMMPYIHILGVFLSQNAAIYTHFCRFFGSKYYHIYTFLVFFGGSECCHIYTFLEFNFVEKTKTKKNKQ